MVGEPEQIKRTGAFFVARVATIGPPERDHSSLVGVQRQTVFAESLRQDREKPFRIFLVLE